MKTSILFGFLILILLISGCGITGNVIKEKQTCQDECNRRHLVCNLNEYYTPSFYSCEDIDSDGCRENVEFYKCGSNYELGLRGTCQHKMYKYHYILGKITRVFEDDLKALGTPKVLTKGTKFDYIATNEVGEVISINCEVIKSEKDLTIASCIDPQKKQMLIPDVSISKKIVKSGDEISLEVKVNDACVSPEFEIYSNSDGKMIRDYEQGGISKICRENLRSAAFTIPIEVKPWWDAGKYFVKVYYWKENGMKDSVKVYFEII